MLNKCNLKLHEKNTGDSLILQTCLNLKNRFPIPQNNLIMKKLVFIIIFSIAFQQLLFTQTQQKHFRCTHRQSFQRSLISDTLDALNYEIHLNEINTTLKTIDAYTIVQLKSKVDDLNEIKLELLELTVDAVWVDNQPVTDFIHESPWLTIPLQNPLQNGDEVEVKVEYHGQPFHEDWGGFHFSGSYAFNLGVGFVSDPHNLGKAWFPCIDDFHDRAFYEVFVTLEEPKMAVCGGTLLEVINNGNGTNTFHWKLNNDIPTYLASVAIGNYENVPMTFQSMTGQEIPIGIYVHPSDTSKVAGSFATLVQTLEAYESYWGPYGWERVGYVGTAIGAMEHVTSIAYPNFCINGTLSYETLWAHELSHMYFGDMVTCESAEDMWLNEGWAVFNELMYLEAIYGPDAAKAEYRDKHQEVLHKAHIDDGGYLALYGIPTEYTYGTTVYQKGCLVTRTLRYYLGDSLFFPAVRAYLDTYKYDYASSWNLRDVLSDESGVDLTDFFDGWVFAPGFPEFSVDSFAVQPDGANFDVTVYMKQKLKGATAFYNSNRVEVTFMDSQWQTDTHLMEFSGETGSETFTTAINPVAVLPDYFDKVADATTDEAKVLKQTGSTNFSEVYAEVTVDEMPAGDSAFVRITHRWVAPDPLLTPVQGLTLSGYRHWRIDGIFPDGFDATGSFFYNKYNYLDNTLLTDPDDSLVILFRPSPAVDWQPVSFTRTGNSNVGYINVPHLQKGDYTLAVWDEMYVGVSSGEHGFDNEVVVFPNPASHEVVIDFGTLEISKVLVFDSSGKNVFEIGNQNHENQKTWDVSGLQPGNYVLNFIEESGDVKCSRKLIVQ